MNVSKAMHRAQFKSLDGHCRFVVRIGRSTIVLTLADLVRYHPKANVWMAFEAGRPVAPR